VENEMVTASTSFDAVTEEDFRFHVLLGEDLPSSPWTGDVLGNFLTVSQFRRPARLNSSMLYQPMDGKSHLSDIGRFMKFEMKVTPEIVDVEG
jgi:hypothetical protein